MMQRSLRLGEQIGRSTKNSRILISEARQSTHAVEKDRTSELSPKLPPVIEDTIIRGGVNDIPGPRALPLIGNTFRFIPYVGEYGRLPVVEQLHMMRKTYGDIVRLEGIVNRRTMVFLFNADLTERMFRQEGIWPVRTALETLLYYRQNRYNFYNGSLGLIVSQGKEWQEMRTKVNKHMVQPRSILPHVGQVSDVAGDFVNRVRTLRDSNTNELPETFNNELNKWALESIASIAMNKRLGCLKPDLAPDSNPQIMINSLHTMFEMMFRLEIQPSLWKIIHTPDLKRLFNAIDTLNSFALKYINQAKEALERCPVSDREGEVSVLQKLLGVDKLVATVMAMDMLTAGVDTTGNSMGALLYYLAINPDKQEKLREEAMRVLPEKDSPVTPASLSEMQYTKASVRESLRMFPISIGTLRTLQHDVVLGGYKIPKGIDMVAANAVVAGDPTNYPQPEKFIPERWMRDQTEFPSAKTAHPFSSLPFGFGARTCAGRRFAELELEVLVLKFDNPSWGHDQVLVKDLEEGSLANQSKLAKHMCQNKARSI